MMGGQGGEVTRKARHYGGAGLTAAAVPDAAR